jgi:hypothetical protein
VLSKQPEPTKFSLGKLTKAKHALVIFAGMVCSVVHCLDIALDALVVQVGAIGIGCKP